MTADLRADAMPLIHPHGYIAATKAARRARLPYDAFLGQLRRGEIPGVYRDEKNRRWWVPVAWLEEQGL